MKYLMAKLRRHLVLVEVHKPTLRLMVHHLSKYKSIQICHLRPDSLALLIHHSGVYAGGSVGVIDGSNGLVTQALQQVVGGQGAVHFFQILKTARLDNCGYLIEPRENIRIWKMPPADPLAAKLLEKVQVEAAAVVHDKFSPIDCLRTIWPHLAPGGSFVAFSIFIEVSL